MITFEEAKAIFKIPFLDLIHKARCEHIKNFDGNEIQIGSLLSVQTGGCSEDCAYCSQSIRNKNKLPKQVITDIETIVHAAKKAKAMGGSRLCMGASGRRPNCDFLELICEAIKAVKKEGMESCVTLGTINDDQARKLKDAGLDYYNHNIDTSPEFYEKIITTRTLGERIATIQTVQKHGIKICTGGILGIGESEDDRIKMLVLLANLSETPDSISINKLVKIPGTPLENAPDLDPFDFVRVIALAKILMPKARVRISAGRESMSDELQALCFLAGASSFFVGEKLLTTKNSDFNHDLALLQRLNLKYLVAEVH